LTERRDEREGNDSGARAITATIDRHPSLYRKTGLSSIEASRRRSERWRSREIAPGTRIALWNIFDSKQDSKRGDARNDFRDDVASSAASSAMIKAPAVMTFQSILFKFRIAPQRRGMLDRQNRGAGKVQCDPKRKSASYADRGGLGRGDGPLFSRLLTVARLSSPLGWTLAALAGAKKRDSFALFIQLASEIHAGFVSRPRYAVRAGAGVFPPPPPSFLRGSLARTRGSNFHTGERNSMGIEMECV